MTASTALLCGILYWLSEANVPYVTVWTIQKPLVCGWITGLILGCPEKGALCGAVISLLYLGYRSHGSSMPSDISLAGICAAAAAAAGAPYGICAVCALPAGFFGILVWQFRLYCNTYFMKQTQSAIEKRDFQGLLVPSALMPSLFSAAVCIPVGALFSLGAYRAAQWAVTSPSIPETLLQITASLGLLLCVAGILFSLFPIHQKRTVLSFLTGIVVVLLTKASLILLILPAGLICVLLVSFLEKRTTDPTGLSAFAAEEDPDLYPDPDLDPDFDPDFSLDPDPYFDPDSDPDFDMDTDMEAPEYTTKKASLPEAFSSTSSIFSLIRSNLWWILFVQAAYNKSLMMGQAAAAAFVPVLRILHPDDPAGQREVLRRQCVYLNTQPEMGSCLLGLLIALEAQKPSAKPERIRSVRSSLMGFFGAIGDELFQCGWIPLLLILASDLVLRGHSAVICVLLYCLLAALSAGALSAISFWTGLTRDEMQLLTLLESDFFHRIRHTLDLLLPFLKGAALASFLLFLLLPAIRS